MKGYLATKDKQYLHKRLKNYFSLSRLGFLTGWRVLLELFITQVSSYPNREGRPSGRSVHAVRRAPPQRRVPVTSQRSASPRPAHGRDRSLVQARGATLQQLSQHARDSTGQQSVACNNPPSRLPSDLENFTKRQPPVKSCRARRTWTTRDPPAQRAVR